MDYDCVKGIISISDILFHESVNKPQPDGSQCFKAWGYYDKTSWLTDEQKARWKAIDDKIAAASK